MPPSPSSFTCPHCGADIHPNAQSCVSCGARKNRHGQWLQNPACDGLDLPRPGAEDNHHADGDEDFDYDDFLKREFGHDRHGHPVKQLPKPAGIPLFWWIIAIITLIAFTSMLVRGLLRAAPPLPLNPTTNQDHPLHN